MFLTTVYSCCFDQLLHACMNSKFHTRAFDIRRKTFVFEASPYQSLTTQKGIRQRLDAIQNNDDEEAAL